MVVLKVVNQDDLGNEFDQGGEVANKVTIRVDKTYITRDPGNNDAVTLNLAKLLEDTVNDTEISPACGAPSGPPSQPNSIAFWLKEVGDTNKAVLSSVWSVGSQAWNPVGGAISDSDCDTYITVEAGSDDSDIIEFYRDGLNAGHIGPTTTAIGNRTDNSGSYSTTAFQTKLGVSAGNNRDLSDPGTVDIGTSAGSSAAAGSSYNINVGQAAGSLSLSAVNTVNIGLNTGFRSTMTRGVNIGQQAGQDATMLDTNNIGFTAGYLSDTQYANNVGFYAGRESSGMYMTNAFGYYALRSAVAPRYVDSIGHLAGYLSNNLEFSVGMGYAAAYRYNENGYINFARYNVNIAHRAGYVAASLGGTHIGAFSFDQGRGDYNALHGYSAGAALVGSRNAGVGVNALSRRKGSRLTAVGADSGQGIQYLPAITATTAGGSSTITIPGHGIPVGEYNAVLFTNSTATALSGVLVVQAIDANTVESVYGSSYGAGTADAQIVREFTNSTALGYGANFDKDNQIVLGDATVTELLTRATAVITGRLPSFATDADADANLVPGQLYKLNGSRQVYQVP